MTRKLETIGAPAADGRVPPLVAQIAGELTDGILSGKYKPGERIREQALADHFETSRAPVREAIRLLEIDGLIVTQHWRGARVVSLEIDEVDDIFEMLSALFGLVAKLAARHGSRDEMRAFAAHVDAMHAAFEGGEAPIEQLALAFDAAKMLRAMCGSPRASEMLFRTSRIAFLSHQVVTNADSAWQIEALVPWRELVTAIAERRDNEAEMVARGIIKHTQEFTMAYLRAHDQKKLKKSAAG